MPERTPAPRRLPRTFAFAVGLLGLLGASGLSSCSCGGPELPDPPVQCSRTTGVGCLPDEQCVDGFCVRFEPCEDDEDCPSAAYRCTFPAQLCELRPGFDLECSDGTDCEPGQFCALGRCRELDDARQCVRRGDCPQGMACSPLHYLCIEEAPCTLADDYPELACDPGETCDLASERCQLECQNECSVATEADDCGPGMRCDAACRCVQCLTDADCGAGLVCNVRAGRCESENLCYSDEDCEEPLICDPSTALCQVPPPPCEDDLDCNIAEICNRVTGDCELPGGACIDDRFEDADTPATAREVDVPQDGEEIVLDELQLCPDDDDVYAIALAAGDRVVARVVGTTPLARATVWLLDAEGETSVRFSEAPPYGNGIIDYTAQNDETVYLRVNALLGPTPYDLSFSRQSGAPCEADVFEGETGNNTTYTARAPGTFPLEQTLVATMCPDDVDYYAVDLGAGEGVDVTLSFDETDLDFDLKIIDASTFALLGQSAGITGTENVRVRTGFARQVLVEVTGFGNSSGGYQIAFDKLEPFQCLADALEPDAQVADATLVPAGTSVQALERTLCIDDVDTWRVPLLDFERVVAQATFAPSELDLVLEVLDATGTTVLESSPNAGGGETVAYDAQGNEEVIVRVRSLFNSQGPYTVSVFRENQLDCAPDELEPNNTVAQAVPAPTTSTSLSICGSDNDLFAVEGVEGKRLVARAAFLHADGDIDVMILGLDGAQLLAASDGVTNHEEASALLPLDGTYYVRVFSLSDGAAARYQLEIELVGE